MLQNILNFLFSLERVTFTPDTRFAFGVGSTWWILPACLVLAVLGYLSYRKQSATPAKRIAAGVVRALILVVVLLLFCRPQLVLDREEKTRSIVAVWVDNSASMSLEDPYKEQQMRDLVKLATNKPATTAPTTMAALSARVNRFELAVDTLARAKWLSTLAESQDVAIFTGSGHAQLLGMANKPEEVANKVRQLKAEKPTGETTDVPTVVNDILQTGQGQRISAIVLMTDGQTTEKGSRLDLAAAAAQRAGARIIALPLGQAEEPLDLKIANLQLPENTFIKDPVSARMTLTGSGVDKATPVKVTLYRRQGIAETPLTSQEFVLDKEKNKIDVDMSFKPEKKGSEKSERYDIIAKAEVIGGGIAAEELTLKNNVVTGHTVVLDAKVNVLYVEGYPRWEYRYLKNELIREKTVNVSTILLSADENFGQEGDAEEKGPDGVTTFLGPIKAFPDRQEELNKYDVLIIGDVEPTFFSPTQQKLIVEFVRKTGGGIAFLAGDTHNPESYRGTPLEVLLPIVPDELDPRARIMAPSDNVAFNLMLTAAGKDSNLFRWFDKSEDNVKQLAELPELYWFKPVQGLKGSAEVFAMHPTRTAGGQPMPLIVVGRYGEGRTLYSGIRDTWRWRRYTGEPLFQSYWLQMCRLLYRNKALGQSKRIELIAESTRVEIGQPLRITMDIKDPTLSTQVPAQVKVRLTDGQGRALDTITLTRMPGQQDRLAGITTAGQLGEMVLSVSPGDAPVDVQPLEVVVTPPEREFEKTAADIESLTTVSVRTTGQVLPLYRHEEAAKLVPDRSLPITIRLSEELWYKPIALLLLIGLLTAEWLIRKSAGLI